MLYRPPRRAPPAWQSPPSIASDSLTTSSSSNVHPDRRQPLRQRMPANQPIREQVEPVVDPKYLQMKSRDSTQNRAENRSENDENNFQNKRNVKPFFVMTNSHKEDGIDAKMDT